MAFFDCHFFSDVLGLSVSAYVLLPQKSARQIGMAGGENRAQYPTLYLLHGLSDDHTIWMRRTSIERYAAAKNIAVVMPAVGRSFYQDMRGGGRYWTFISEELPVLCRHFFPLSAAREDNFAAGLSMGGYGALRLGLGKPGHYAAVASLSGALDLARRVRDAARPESPISTGEFVSIFGPDANVEGGGSDLFHLVQDLGKTDTVRPKLYLACGADDPLLDDNRRFHQHLDSKHVEHTYVEDAGRHEWSYWDKHIQHVLDWLPLTK